MKFFIIQTAFIGDAILASSLLETLHEAFPESEIDLMIRKGNEGLFDNHPYIKKIYIWNKKDGKYKSLYKILKEVRKIKYHYVINLQRFATTGLFAAFSNGKKIIGFQKNPFSFLFNEKFEHEISNGKHEIERNYELIRKIVDIALKKPKLYPQSSNYNKVEQYKKNEYITISPASVWYTKQYPADKWIEYINTLDKKFFVYLLGGPGDKVLCKEIEQNSDNENIITLAGELNFLDSAALMLDAAMNFTNDSAPLHIASAMNALVTSVFCSTVSGFGFTPVSDHSKVVEIGKSLSCRPCGLHGKKQCPKGNFECAYGIDVEMLKF